MQPCTQILLYMAACEMCKNIQLLLTLHAFSKYTPNINNDKYWLTTYSNITVQD